MRYFFFALLLHVLVFTLFFNDRRMVSGDPQLTPTAEQVFADAKALGYKIPNFYILTLVFEDDAPQKTHDTYVRIGYTRYWRTPTPVITINRSSWLRFDSTQRYMLIIHEIGHAIWQREHDETLLPDFTPRSIMAPAIFPVDIFERSKLYYQKELFSTVGDL